MELEEHAHGGLHKVVGRLQEVQRECKQRDTVIFAPFRHIDHAMKEAEDSSICIGAENCSKTGGGAFTGEVLLVKSPTLASSGC